MIQKHSTNSDPHVLADLPARQPIEMRHDLGADETVGSFETAELDVVVDANDPSAVKPTTPLTRPRPSRTNVDVDRETERDLDSQFVWESTVRGVPSWLTSLILHLSLILILALVSVSDGGKKVIDLIAATTDSVHVEPITEVKVVLETEEIETLAEDTLISDADLVDDQDLESLIDLSSASELKTSINGQLFESLATEGLSSTNATSSNGGGGGASFFGIDGSGSDFVYIVDCSGSMGETVSRSLQRWDLAKQELKKSINELKPDQKFLILLYNNGFIAMNDDAKLVPSSKRERNRALRWLGKNTPGNWTFCADALAKALSLKPDSIFLLSDGEFDDRQNVFLVLDQMNNKRRLVSTNEKHVPIHTVALGSHYGRWTMKRIADENDGVFRLVE